MPTEKPITVLLKKSSVAGKVPSPDALSHGELAINFKDLKIYTKGHDDLVIDLLDLLNSHDVSVALATIQYQTNLIKNNQEIMQLTFDSDTQLAECISTIASQNAVIEDQQTQLNILNNTLTDVLERLNILEI